jgi:hypothetical protein
VVKHLIVLAGVIVSLTSAILMLRGVMFLMIAKREFGVALQFAKEHINTVGANPYTKSLMNNATFGGYEMPGSLVPGKLSAKDRSGARPGMTGWLEYLLGSVGFSLTNDMLEKLGSMRAGRFNPFRKRSLFAVPNPADMQLLSGTTASGARQKNWFTSIMGASYRMGRVGVDPRDVKTGLADHAVAGNARGGFSGGVVTQWAGTFMLNVGQFVNRLRTFPYAKFFNAILKGFRLLGPTLRFVASAATRLSLIFVLMYAGIKDAVGKVWVLAKSFWELVNTIIPFQSIMAALQPLWEELTYYWDVLSNTILRMLSPARLLTFVMEVFLAVIDSIAAVIVPVVNLVAAAFGGLFGVLMKGLNIVEEIAAGLGGFFGHIAGGDNVFTAAKKAFWGDRDYAGKNTTLGQIGSASFDFAGDRLDSILSDSANLFSEAGDHLMNAYNAYYEDPTSNKKNKENKKSSGKLGEPDIMQPTRHTGALVYGTAAAYNDSITVSLLERIANNTDPNKNRHTPAVQLAQYTMGD